MQDLKEPERPDRAGNPIEEDDKVPSPFKLYEDKYCSRCLDYRGCIGLIGELPHAKAVRLPASLLLY